MEEAIAELKEVKADLERQVAELRAKAEQVERRATELRQAEEKKHAEEIDFLKKTNQQLKVNNNPQYDRFYARDESYFYNNTMRPSNLNFYFADTK